MAFTDAQLEKLKRDVAIMPDIDVCNFFEDGHEIDALIKH